LEGLRARRALGSFRRTPLFEEIVMRIGIIGAGNVGGGLAAAAIAAGHHVTVAAAHQDRAARAAAQTGATAASDLAEVVQGADVVLMAVPAAAAAEVLGRLGEAAADAVVVDATNPLNDTFSDLTTSGISHAEQLASAAPRVKLVKAFNTILASRLGSPSEDGQPLDGFYAGDDEAAKAQVAQLLGSLGFRPIDVGGLRMARSLEEMAFLNISLNARNGWSWQSGWKLAGPTA
jgi:8-hydroxy-5-deazaflavin:NADPH oxidoreductase